MRSNLLYWLPALLCAALIFFFSTRSAPPVTEQVSDYLAHFLEYAFFALTLVWGATSGFLRQLTSIDVAWLWIVAVLYGLSDEFHQSFVPGRHASLSDIAADALGALSCLTVAYLIRRGKWR
jgi:VanZ family protein